MYVADFNEADQSNEWDIGDTSRRYLLRILLEKDPDGGFTATLARLPGVVSEGDTIEEALENIMEAFRGAAESYLESGDIPWTDPIEGCDDVSQPRLRRVVCVHV